MKRMDFRRLLSVILSVIFFIVTAIPSFGYSGVGKIKKPGKVYIKSIKASGTSVIIKWKKVKDAKGYQVFRYDHSSKKYKLAKNINDKKKISYKQNNLKEGKTYRYKVRAYKTVKVKKWYNNKTKKWQVKKPSKKICGKSKMFKVKEYGKFSSSKKVKISKKSNSNNSSDNSEERNKTFEFYKFKDIPVYAGYTNVLMILSKEPCERPWDKEKGISSMFPEMWISGADGSSPFEIKGDGVIYCFDIATPSELRGSGIMDIDNIPDRLSDGRYVYFASVGFNEEKSYDLKVHLEKSQGLVVDFDDTITVKPTDVESDYNRWIDQMLDIFTNDDMDAGEKLYSVTSGVAGLATYRPARSNHLYCLDTSLYHKGHPPFKKMNWDSVYHGPMYSWAEKLGIELKNCTEKGLDWGAYHAYAFYEYQGESYTISICPSTSTVVEMKDRPQLSLDDFEKIW